MHLLEKLNVRNASAKQDVNNYGVVGNFSGCFGVTCFTVALIG